jgi:NitT/TauT family transport system substrate-binding protein
MAESLAYAGRHPDEVRAVISTYTQITADVTAKIILPAWPSAVNKDSVQTLTDLAVQDKLLDKAPPLDDLIP